MRLANRRLANRLSNLRSKSGHSRHIQPGGSPGKGDVVVMAWSEGNAAAVSRHNARKWERPRHRWIVQTLRISRGKLVSRVPRVPSVAVRRYWLWHFAN